MVKLSNRMNTIAGFVNFYERVGDIGTDHAHIPIFLWQNNITRHIILSDLNSGPLQKADENIRKELGKNPFELRQSNGLQGFYPGEIDTAIIAGMGGLLIRDILSENTAKTCSIKKLILQPRNAQAALRHWLFASGIVITDETLALEGKYICEIIVAKPDHNILFTDSKSMPDEIDFEISPILFQKKDPLLPAFLLKKIAIDEKISQATKQTQPEKHLLAAKRIEIFQSMMEKIT